MLRQLLVIGTLAASPMLSANLEQPFHTILDQIQMSSGCKAPQQGPPGLRGPAGPRGAIGPAGAIGPSGAKGATGATGATGTCECPALICASYSLPFPPGALQVNTYEPIPFTSTGLNANFGGIVLDDSTSIFTIPADGYYEISYGYSSSWGSGTIVGLGIFIANTFDHIVPNSSISQGITAAYQMTSGNMVIPLNEGDQIALINTNILAGGGCVPTDYVGLVPYSSLNAQEQSAAFITIQKVGDL